MAVTLAITDNGDGTGGVATVSGVVALTSTTVYYALFNGNMQAYTWVSAGVVVGNDDLVLALPVGFYAWLAVNNNAGAVTISGWVYQNLTDVVTPIHKRILEGVQQRIISIGLEDIPDSRVVVRWIPQRDAGGLAVPHILVTPLGVENDQSILMARDDIGYPVFVTIVDGINRQDDLNLRRDLRWREQIAKSLRNQKLSGVPEVFDTKIDYGQTVDVQAYLHNALVSLIMFRFLVRETRGLE